MVHYHTPRTDRWSVNSRSHTGNRSLRLLLSYACPMRCGTRPSHSTFRPTPSTTPTSAPGGREVVNVLGAL